MPNDDAIRRIALRLTGEGEDPTAVESVLRESPAFSGDLSWIDEVNDAAEFMPIHQVPAELHKALVGLLGYERPGQPPQSQKDSSTFAILVEDSRVGVLAGVRDSTNDSSEWTWVFADDATELILDISTDAAGLVRVAGEVVTSVELTTFEVISDQVASPLRVDAANEHRFVLRGLQPTVHTCTIKAPGLSLSWMMDLRP